MNRSLVEQVWDILRPYGGKPEELIQALHRVQSTLGYVPKEVQGVVAEALEVPPSQVRGVLSFYHFFRTTPPGKHTIRTCLGTACYVRGASRVLEAIEEELGITLGQTDPQGLFSLEGVRCLGCCGLAPVMMVDAEVYGRLEPKKVKGILKEWRERE